jgi:hypothetical protein
MTMLLEAETEVEVPQLELMGQPFVQQEMRRF